MHVIKQSIILQGQLFFALVYFITQQSNTFIKDEEIEELLRAENVLWEQFLSVGGFFFVDQQGAMAEGKKKKTRRESNGVFLLLLQKLNRMKENISKWKQTYEVFHKLHFHTMHETTFSRHRQRIPGLDKRILLNHENDTDWSKSL